MLVARIDFVPLMAMQTWFLSEGKPIIPWLHGALPIYSWLSLFTKIVRDHPKVNIRRQDLAAFQFFLRQRCLAESVNCTNEIERCQLRLALHIHKLSVISICLPGSEIQEAVQPEIWGHLGNGVCLTFRRWDGDFFKKDIMWSEICNPSRAIEFPPLLPQELYSDRDKKAYLM